jgi:hypothetical protein
MTRSNWPRTALLRPLAPPDECSTTY